MFRAGKDNRCLVAVLFEQFLKQVALFSLCDEVDGLFNLVRRLTRRCDLNSNWILQIGLCDFIHLLWHGGREQHGLTFGRENF